MIRKAKSRVLACSMVWGIILSSACTDTSNDNIFRPAESCSIELHWNSYPVKCNDEDGDQYVERARFAWEKVIGAYEVDPFEDLNIEDYPIQVWQQAVEYESSIFRILFASCDQSIAFQVSVPREGTGDAPWSWANQSFQTDAYAEIRSYDISQASEECPIHSIIVARNGRTVHGLTLQSIHTGCLEMLVSEYSEYDHNQMGRTISGKVVAGSTCMVIPQELGGREISVPLPKSINIPEYEFSFFTEPLPEVAR